MEALATLGWREALIAVIALLVLYMCAVFLRMWRLRRIRVLAERREPEPGRVRDAKLAYAEGAQTPLSEPEEPPPPPPVRKPRDFPWNEPPPPFAGQDRIEALEREVGQLRYQLDEQGAELAAVREQLRREVSQTRAAQNVSPIYSDAMQMALQGHNAGTISEHCGIARAEAELVVALVRNREDGE